MSVYLTGRALHRLPVRAGQFFVWRFLDGRGWSRGHPFSLSARPHPSMLRITVKDLGDGSRRLADLRPGTRVLLEGPYGALTTTGAPGRPGDAARRRASASPRCAPAGGAAHPAAPWCTGPATRPSWCSGPSWKRWRAPVAAGWPTCSARAPGTGRGCPRPGATSGEAAALRHLVPDVAGQDVYVCGPEAWTDAAMAAARAAGVPDAQVHVERFTY